MFLASLEDEHRVLQARLLGLAKSEDGVPQRVQRYLEAVAADYCPASPDAPGLAWAAGLAEVTGDRRVAVWVRRLHATLMEAAEAALRPAPREWCELLADLAMGLCVRHRLAQGGIAETDLADRARRIGALFGGEPSPASPQRTAL